MKGSSFLIPHDAKVRADMLTREGVAQTRGGQQTDETHHEDARQVEDEGSEETSK